MSMLTTMPSLALVLLLGMRHGLDPDHLAAIDGLTLRTMPLRPRWAPWMGGLFALGHGIVVLAIVAATALASQAYQPSAQLFAWLEWLPVALLLALAAMNARALLQTDGYPLAPLRLVLLPARWRGQAGPVGGVALGMVFALVFETALQAAAWGYASVALGGVGGALLVGLVFTVGMAITDLLDGWVTARVMRSGRRDVINAFRRRLGWPIVGMCVAVAVYLIASKLAPDLALAEHWYSALGAAMMAAMAGLYGYTLYGLRRAAPVTCSADTGL